MADDMRNELPVDPCTDLARVRGFRPCHSLSTLDCEALARVLERYEKSARRNLLAMMQDYSEDRFCSGWAHFLEFTLWREAVDGQQPEFQRAAALADGWWVWRVAENPDETGEVFVPLPEWMQQFEAEMKRREVERW